MNNDTIKIVSKIDKRKNELEVIKQMIISLTRVRDRTDKIIIDTEKYLCFVTTCNALIDVLREQIL
jgi:hypothetical protein